MKIGVPKEIKNHEYRAGLTPASVSELVRHGHEVMVQADTGTAIGFSDADYQAAGAQTASCAEEVFAHAELIVKVKEPQPDEVALLREGQILFTFLHLAAERALTEGLMRSGCSAIAYETVTDSSGGLPLLAPMSEVAGRLAPQVGAHHLQKAQGGRGVLLGGVTGVAPGKVTIVGGGSVGHNAATIALGMGAEVTILDKNVARLRWLNDHYRGRVRALYSSTAELEQRVTEADLVIGAVLVPGAAAPKLINKELLKKMQPGAVLVDVAIDQGGCFETSRPTTHQQPTFEVDGIIHYCVTNMPGAVARTATQALNNVTLPFVIALANKGLEALLDDHHLAAGVNTHRGKVCCQAVAKAHDLRYSPVQQSLET